MRTMENLTRLRGELDRIDDELLALVEQRLTLCRRIALCKGSGPELKLNPRRQRAVVARLQAQASESAAPAVPDVWREVMAHCLQVQASMRFLVPAGAQNREQLVRLVRAQYGSASPIEWVEQESDALVRAERRDAVAIVPGSKRPRLTDALIAFDQLRDEHGARIGWLVGRVSADAAELSAAEELPSWRPSSWRTREARQQPHYPNPGALSRVEQRLAARAPLVELHDVDTLKARLAEAARGNALVLQGGDCVETFREYSPDKVSLTVDLLSELGRVISSAADCPVVHIGRIAGQFAKPRSAGTEISGGIELPVYRGDGVNGEDADPEARMADPRRLLVAHDQAAATMQLLWHGAEPSSEPIYASHEALLLNVEQALTQSDELSGRWWAGSGHMLWIGDRTRQLDGAHVEYARGIANPIGLKCGPSLEAEELLRLAARLDPNHEPGRLMVIPRLGREGIAQRLPGLMRAAQREGHNWLWCVDPMHGNTRLVDGRKTRLLSDIAAETVAFHDIARAEGVWPGGIHLELTGTDVLECTGGRRRLFGLRTGQRYLSGCDPRLNPAQARELAVIVAEWHAAEAADVRKYG